MELVYLAKTNTQLDVWCLVYFCSDVFSGICRSDQTRAAGGGDHGNGERGLLETP